MTLTQKIQKNSIYKRVFLYLMTLGHFWPLVAEKAKKPNSEIPKNSFFCLFQPPEAENDQKSKKKNFLCTSPNLAQL